MILYSIRHFRSIGKNAQHVLFVGSVEEMKELYEHMQNKEFGYNVVGLFTDGNERIEGLETLGGADEAMAYLESHPYVNAVYCTMSHVSKDTVIALYKYCENNLIRFYVLPMYVGYLRRHMRVSHVGSTMLLSPRREPLRQFENRLLKRAVDFVVSALFLLTVFPIVYIVVAILIKRQSPGPIIFVQKRNGLNGKEFNCYKFRSMFVNGEADQTQATEDDERKFPFGDFMRRRNIDELPQFVNVSDTSASLQIALLGLTFAIQGLIIFSLVAICAGRLREVILKNKNLGKVFGIVEGVVLSLIAVALIVS